MDVIEMWGDLTPEEKKKRSKAVAKWAGLICFILIWLHIINSRIAYMAIFN